MVAECYRTQRTMARRHVVISGTGRAGTTFLVELLTHLGLDTGYSLDELRTRKDSRARAGLEHDIRKAGSPYIVKSPHFCDYADEVARMTEIAIEHVFIPMRDLRAAAESRRFVSESAAREFSFVERVIRKLRNRTVRGGLWQTSSAAHQETVLLQQLYKLTLALSGTMIPVTLLRYPRLVKDASYLYDKLSPILRDVDRARFTSAFDRVADVKIVHSFSKADH
jgi:hypothetical protein